MVSSISLLSKEQSIGSTTVVFYISGSSLSDSVNLVSVPGFLNGSLIDSGPFFFLLLFTFGEASFYSSFTLFIIHILNFSCYGSSILADVVSEVWTFFSFSSLWSIALPLAVL